jgi:hypothetical protein
LGVYGQIKPDRPCQVCNCWKREAVDVADNEYDCSNAVGAEECRVDSTDRYAVFLVVEIC